MIPPRETQKTALFKGMSQKMIEKLAAAGEVLETPANKYLFHRGDPAHTFYIVCKGKVILEFEEGDGSQCCEEVGPGMGVGCSSLAGLKCYQCHAFCEEPCRLLSWSQSTLRHLFNQDSRMGYLMIKASAKMLNKRVLRIVGFPRAVHE